MFQAPGEPLQMLQELLIYKDGPPEQLQLTSRSVPSRAAGDSTEHLQSTAWGWPRHGPKTGTPSHRPPRAHQVDPVSEPILLEK